MSALALASLYTAGCGGDEGKTTDTGTATGTTAKTQTATPATTTAATGTTAGSSSAVSGDSSGGAAASSQGASQSSAQGAASLTIGQVYIPIYGVKVGQQYPMGAQISGNARV